MPELSSVGSAAENILNGIVEVIAENVPKPKSRNFFEEESSIKSQFNRLFGRQKPIHYLLGGGKPADVLLWRNKKISVGALAGATAIWILFEWLNYHLLSLSCFALAIGMFVLFLWTNASRMFSRSSTRVPRFILPEELFVNIAVAVGAEVNRFLRFLQDVSSGKNLKHFILVVASLWFAAIIGSWCNFLTVIYIGFIAAHILPVVYERYEDRIDGFAYSALGKLQRHYQKLDTGVLSKIPKANLKLKKID